MVMGDSGIFKKANWSKFVTEFYNVEESSNLYKMSKDIEKYGSKNEMASIGTQVVNSIQVMEEKDCYPTKGNKKNISELDTGLQQTIMQIETEVTNETDLNDESKVELYEIDSSLINMKELKNKYIVNIKSGKIYLLNDSKFKFEGKDWYRPDCGVSESGKVYYISGDIKILEEKYQFASKAKDTVKIEIDVNKSSDLNVTDVKFTNDGTTGKGTVKNENYDKTTNIYTAEIECDGTTDSNGEYYFEIVAEDEDGNLFPNGGTTKVHTTVSKFVENPTINITNEKYNSFEIEIADPDIKAGIGYKYNCKLATGSYGTATTITLSKNEETQQINPVKITKIDNGTSLVAETNYKVKITATLNGESVELEEDVTTTEMKLEIEYIEDLISMYRGFDWYGDETQLSEAEINDNITTELSFDATSTSAAYNSIADALALSYSYELKNDLDFKNRNSYKYVATYDYFNQDEDGDGNPDNSWISIGYSPSSSTSASGVPFTGSFSGNYHKICNLYINNDKSAQALFGRIANATIEKLKIENPFVSAKDSVSALVAISLGDNNLEQVGIYATSDNFYISSKNGSYNGALIGYKMGSNSLTVKECFSEINVRCIYSSTSAIYFGNLIGRGNSGDVNIENCYASGSLSR